MVFLRPTRKLHALLPPGPAAPTASDAALGDWYVNRIVVARRPLLLLVSSTSLFPILTPAQDVRALPARLPGLVENRLRRYDIDPAAIAAEVKAMAPIAIAPTADRSVLGTMTDFAFNVSYHLDGATWDDDDLIPVEESLAEMPCRAGRPRDQVIFPDRKAPELLHAKWTWKA